MALHSNTRESGLVAWWRLQPQNDSGSVNLLNTELSPTEAPEAVGGENPWQTVSQVTAGRPFGGLRVGRPPDWCCTTKICSRMRAVSLMSFIHKLFSVTESTNHTFWRLRKEIQPERKPWNRNGRGPAFAFKLLAGGQGGLSLNYVSHWVPQCRLCIEGHWNRSVAGSGMFSSSVMERAGAG